MRRFLMSVALGSALTWIGCTDELTSPEPDQDQAGEVSVQQDTTELGASSSAAPEPNAAPGAAPRFCVAPGSPCSNIGGILGKGCCGVCMEGICE